MNEKWVHHFTPGSKQQSKQWKDPDSPPAKEDNDCSIRSAGKVMASIFWGPDGIVMTDYFHKGQTINGTYHASLLSQLRENIRIKRRRGGSRFTTVSLYAAMDVSKCRDG